MVPVYELATLWEPKSAVRAFLRSGIIINLDDYAHVRGYSDVANTGSLIGRPPMEWTGAAESTESTRILVMRSSRNSRCPL